MEKGLSSPGTIGISTARGYVVSAATQYQSAAGPQSLHNNECKFPRIVVNMYLKHGGRRTCNSFRRPGLPAESPPQPNVDCGGLDVSIADAVIEKGRLTRPGAPSYFFKSPNTRRIV